MKRLTKTHIRKSISLIDPLNQPSPHWFTAHLPPCVEEITTISHFANLYVSLQISLQCHRSDIHPALIETERQRSITVLWPH